MTAAAEPIAEPIVLACAADDLFAMPLAVMLRSALSNLNRDRRLWLFLLDGGIRPANRRKIVDSLDRDRIQIEWVRPSTVALERLWLLCKYGYPISNYYRLLLPEIIPASVTKAIYLDSDIVVRGNLEQLWNLDLGDRYLLAAVNGGAYHLGMVEHLQGFDFTPYPQATPDQPYFNAGVLVLNLERWRQDRIAEQVIDLIARYHDLLLFPDQDAMNILLAQQWGQFSPQWNQVHCIYDYATWQDSPYPESEFQEARHNPAIVHFTSRPKPWVPGCLHPGRALFHEYRAMTAWADWRSTPWNRAMVLWQRIWRKLIRAIKRPLALKTQRNL